jgi:glycosyltransferase involved in cell wall biosynthesis
MRILHLIDSLDPRLGGPQAVALRLAAAQSSNGDASAIITHRPDSEAATRIELSMRAIPGMSKIPVIQVDRPSSLLGSLMSITVGRWIKEHGRDWDVIHIHNVWDPPVRAGSVAALAAGIPYVITPHASLDPWAMRQTFAKIAKKRVALALQMRSLIDSATFLHALNDEEVRGISLEGFRSPTEVVANGIFASEFESLPAKGSFRAAFPKIGDRPFVLFLSRLHFKKGLDYLVDSFARAAARVGDLQLVVAGPDDGGRAAMQRDVQARGLDDRVHVTGPLYGESKLAALVDAEVFCLPSRMEGFSIAILEALACECPVVISRQCNFPEVAANDAGIVTALDSTEISEGIVSLAEDPLLRARLVARGRRMVHERFTWPVIARKMRDAYLRHGVSDRPGNDC